MTAAPLPLQVVGYAVMGLGVALFAVAAVGLVRFPDTYSRLSAVTKAATLGVCLVLVGVLVVDPTWRAAVAVVLAVALQLVTSPVGGFALGRAAYHTGAPLAPAARYDHLARDEAARAADAGPGDRAAAVGDEVAPPVDAADAGDDPPPTLAR
ncbi:MAG: monovalent cation/H(+) antiporter subunit G [Kineosporiaceae bacterium]